MVDAQPAACSASGGTPLNQRSTGLVLLDDEAAVQRKCGSTIAPSEECVSSKVAAGRGVNAEAVAGPGLGRPRLSAPGDRVEAFGEVCELGVAKWSSVVTTGANASSRAARRPLYHSD
jgi:hypothetical protein